MKKIKFIFISLILLTNYLFSQSAGTTGFEFLRSEYSPRGAGMAGNLIAVKNDIQSIFYNPAALSGNTDRQWSINYTDHLLDFQGGHILFATPSSLLGNINAGLIYFNYGSFEETDDFGDATGRDFSAGEFAFTAGISNKLGLGFDYGVGLKFIYSGIDNYDAYGIAMDLGLIYTVPSIDDFQFGISLLNFGKTINNYTTYEEKVPLLLRVGFAKKLAHLPLMLTGSLSDLSTNEEKFVDRIKKFAVGGEFDVSEIIKFRLGYQNEINQSVRPLGRNAMGGISLGLGVFWKTLRFDYSYSNFGDLGSQNRLGITGVF